MDMSLNGKRILLLYARFFGYDQIVKTELENLGADVDLYDARANISTFEKALLKIYSGFYRRKQIKFHMLIQNQNMHKHYDYIFTNENLDKDILLRYKTLYPDAKLILYLDDSAKNLRHVEKTFEYYDKVMTFDRGDSEEYGIDFRPLFFNKIVQESDGDNRSNYNLCFIGTIHSDRLNVIDKLCEDINGDNYIYMYLQSPFMYFYYYITNPVFRKYKFTDFRYKQLPMSVVAEKMAESNVILDIQHPNQTGLTMRTIETLGKRRKIVTTNSDIKNYDFYNSGNIAIIDREKPIVDGSFWSSEYKNVPSEMYYKYSIEGWIKDIFN